MKELSEKVCFTLEQELENGGEVPSEVQLLPSGEVRPKGKAAFLVDGESRAAILASFSESETELVIDYEHQSLSGSEAPAAGWVMELIDKGEDGVWAAVKWTERAQQYLKSREYRYISPVVLIRKKDGRAVELLGAGLTNLPAIDGMVPVVNSRLGSGHEGAADADTAYEERYRRVLELVGLTGEPEMAEVEARLMNIVDTTGFVPASEHEALKKELQGAMTEMALKDALSDGRITPSLVPWARRYAAGDPEGFRDFLGKASPAVPLSALVNEPAPGGLDHSQREVNRLLGINDGTFMRLSSDGAEL